MYKLKDALKRGVAFATAGAMLGGALTTALPASVYAANELNPLTERSLMLSSSAPGYRFTDGSGNTTYSGPGTGNNGQKTGETFQFKVTTDSSDNDPLIQGWTFQYCTTPAGECTTPGNVGEVGLDADETSNLHISDPDPVLTPWDEGTNFDVYVDGVLNTGWTMEVDRVIDNPVPTDTGATDNNFIVLYKTAGMTPATGDQIRVVFKATDTHYITNPGSSAFFVKVNNYSTDDPAEMLPFETENIVDGGVTVANVMNDSIWLQTKVLETMYFSVGTKNPDTRISPPGGHKDCGPITENVPLKMGDDTAEDSLSVEEAYDQYSYWRLSSNSSSGATVYYSGNSLSNTVGDVIDEIGNVEESSLTGQEQFGLALDTTPDTYDPGYLTFSDNTIDPLIAYNGDDTDINGNPLGLNAETDYSNGDGTITDGGTAKFAFVGSSLTSPEPFATFDDDVIECSTGKMRYVANIAANTPAGVYTSKINYIASPQY